MFNWQTHLTTPLQKYLLTLNYFFRFRNQAITPLEQILLTLRFYATGTMQQCTGDFFGISKSSACNVIHAVSRTICTKLNYFIEMPRTTEEIREVVAKFYSIAKFPSVVGAIDCTHIRILSPGRYLNTHFFIKLKYIATYITAYNM